MPSLGDSVVIIFLGLLLFGPKGLAQIARQLGKLMGEFRRASNEFRMQMEEELRLAEQEDRQKKIAAIEAAAPAPPVLASSMSSSVEQEGADPPDPRAAAADTQLVPLAEQVAEPAAEDQPPADRDLGRVEHHAAGDRPALAEIVFARCLHRFRAACGDSERARRSRGERRLRAHADAVYKPP